MGDQAATTRHQPESGWRMADDSCWQLLNVVKSCVRDLRVPEKCAIFASVMKTANMILKEMEALGHRMSREQEVWRAELADRLRLGLSGDKAIDHYNAWMEKYGMEHLKVKKA